MRMDEHGGAVQKVEGGQHMAKCYCQWTCFKNNKPEAEQALDAHVTSMTLKGDEGGRIL